MTNSITMDGWHIQLDPVTNLTKKVPVPITKELTYTDNMDGGYGQPISIELFLEMRKKYKDLVDKGDEKLLREILKRTMSVAFGVESLTALMIQQGCRCVSFFWGINDFDTSNIHPTLMACGSFFNNASHEIEPLQLDSINSRNSSAEIRPVENNSLNTLSDTLIIEVVPQGPAFNNFKDLDLDTIL